MNLTVVCAERKHRTDHVSFQITNELRITAEKSSSTTCSISACSHACVCIFTHTSDLKIAVQHTLTHQHSHTYRHEYTLTRGSTEMWKIQACVCVYVSRDVYICVTPAFAPRSWGERESARTAIAITHRGSGSGCGGPATNPQLKLI